METKVCIKCNQELPLEEFYKVPSMKSGLDNSCKNCRRELKTGHRTPNTLYCPVCKRELPYYNFDIARKSTTGRMWCCKECYNSKPPISDNHFRARYDPNFRDMLFEQKRASRIRNFVHAMWKAAKDRADKKGLEFNIEESDILIPTVCPLLNIPIEFGTKEDYNSSPSLDRIDNTKGYIKGNIWVISKKANTMKNSATLKELHTFCTNMLRYSPNFTKEEGKETEDKEPL